MQSIVVTPPAQIITTAEAKLHAKVDFSADDAVIDVCAQLAQAYIEAETGKRVGEQTIDICIDGFGDGREIDLEESPVISIVSVKYLDTDGAEQTLSADKYSLIPGTRARLWLKPAESWPSTYDRPQSVTVRVTAGWVRTAAEGKTLLPGDLLKLHFLLINHYYEHRELVYTGLQMREYPEHLTAKAICAHYQRVNV